MQDELRVEIVQHELTHMQQQIDKYDAFSDKIKTWAVTLWAALMGWSLQSGRSEALLFAAVIMCAFWIFDAIKRSVRQDYKYRRGEVAEALNVCFQTGAFPTGFSSPKIPEHKNWYAIKYFFMPHMLLSYGPLVLVSVVVFFILSKR